MTTWQYRIETIDYYSKDLRDNPRPLTVALVEMLNAHGAEGWELADLRWLQQDGRLAPNLIECLLKRPMDKP